jgi:hypothetical protein
MTMTVNAEVTGWETVDIPAGSFKALKLIYKTNWSTDNPPLSGTSTGTAWYSPDAKLPVQVVYEVFGADGSPQTRTKTQLVQYQVK